MLLFRSDFFYLSSFHLVDFSSWGTTLCACSASFFYRNGHYYLLFLFLLLAAFPVSVCLGSSNDSSNFKLEQLGSEGKALNQHWKFHPGDNASWADPAFDDSQWDQLNPGQDLDELAQLREAEIGWFRLHLQVDSSLLNIPLAITLFQIGASEVYLNGKLIHRFGKVSKHPEEEILFNPNHNPYTLQFSGGTKQVLAVRYSFTKGNPYLNFLGIWGGNPALVIKIMPMDDAIQKLLYEKTVITSRLVGKATFLFVLAFLHLFFYIKYPCKRVNLYYSLFTVSFALGYFLEHIFRFMPREGSSYFVIGLFCSIVLTQHFIWGLMALYSHARQKKDWYFWFVVFCACTFIISWSLPNEIGYYFFAFYTLLCPLIGVRVSFLAIRKKIEGAWVVFIGWLVFFIFATLFCLFLYNVLPRLPYDIAISLDIAVFSVAVTFSVILAIEYAKNKKSLQDSLLEVEVKRLESEKMHELDKTKSNFFANISHEFRTPLTLISGTVEKLHQEEKQSLQRKEEYTLIQRNAKRLLQLINQLLDLSKLEAGNLQVNKQAGEIQAFLYQMAGSFVSLFESKGILYRYELPVEPIHVYFDPDKLEKVLTNLLFNAFKFTPPGGEVKLLVTLLSEEADQGLLQILVHDTGIGIAEDQLQHIFERFYQAEAGTMKSFEGTGIGLALVKELIELQGGTISCSSTPGKGAYFYVNLPMFIVPQEKVLQSDHQQEEKIPAMSVDWYSAVFKGDGEASLPSDRENPLYKVLVVEDNPELRRFISGSLADLYEVLEAENGRTGYECANDTIPDLIISDIMMPELDGVSLCEKLKGDERTSHIPLILLTARADVKSKMAGLETGADDYQLKPFKMEELRVRVRNLITLRRKLRERYSRSLSLQPSAVAVSSVDEKFIQKVMAIVEANLSNTDFDVERFSREVGMSRVQLHRKLTALTDQSASEFIRSFRLKRAASLLEQQAGNITEIAYIVGFNSLPYFTKCFKEQWGQTPSEFIAALKQKQAI